MEFNDRHRNLVDDCKNGVRKAQFELYRLYAKAMFNICLRMVKNEADAEDILQNSFIDVFTKIDTFRFESSVGAWIKRIVVNNCINFLKKRRLDFEVIDERIADLEEPPTEIQPKISVHAVKEALFRLPEGYRVVFSLYQMEGYDHGEIAEILNISEQTSKSQYSRAKKKLRELLSQPIGKVV